MTPRQWIELALSRFSDFQGRSSRSEFWWFMAAISVVTLVITLIERMIGLGGAYGRFGLFSGLWILATLVPSLSAAIRRLHDTDRSGWWVLLSVIPSLVPMVLAYVSVGLLGALSGAVQIAALVCNLVLLAFLVLPGVPLSNRFGEVAP